jgi:hypothetical protein
MKNIKGGTGKNININQTDPMYISSCHILFILNLQKRKKYKKEKASKKKKKSSKDEIIHFEYKIGDVIKERYEVEYSSVSNIFYLLQR